MEKHIYFVRHGQSEENVSRVFKGASSPLTDEGREQAQMIAERIQRIGVDALLSSPFVRAHDTAAAISAQTGVAIETSALLGEWLEPSAVSGLHIDDPKRQSVREAIDAAAADHDHRHSDEETFSELSTRAKAVIQMLEEHPASRICVVTHGGFLKVIVGTIVFGETFNKAVFLKMVRNMPSTNTGVTYARYTEDYPRWQLITWNDKSHLG